MSGADAAARAAYESLRAAERRRYPARLRWPEWGDLRPGERDDWDAAVRAAADTEREAIAARIDEMAANYPESVFPSGSGSRDAISGTAMRHAYRTAARLIRQLGSLRDGEEPYPPADEIASLDTDVMEEW